MNTDPELAKRLRKIEHCAPWPFDPTMMAQFLQLVIQCLKVNAVDAQRLQLAMSLDLLAQDAHGVRHPLPSLPPENEDSVDEEGDDSDEEEDDAGRDADSG